jgi:hypothetical protein
VWAHPLLEDGAKRETSRFLLGHMEASRSTKESPRKTQIFYGMLG